MALCDRLAVLLECHHVAFSNRGNLPTTIHLDLDVVARCIHPVAFAVNAGGSSNLRRPHHFVVVIVDLEANSAATFIP